MAVNDNRELAQKERELQLLLALDEARDAFEDPESLFEILVKLLKRHFQAEACAILFTAGAAQEEQYIAALGVTAETARDLCHEAVTFTAPHPLSSNHWPHTLGVPIILDDKPLGGLFIARANQPFDETEMALLQLAESQIDSAIIQARMVWRNLERTRELEAIYEIDRLRDFTTNENDLVSGFTTILLRRFQADLCMVMLNQSENGELLVRGIVDKFDMSAQAVTYIRETAARVEKTQTIPAPPGFNNVMLLAAPFIVSRSRFGAIVVGRSRPFSPSDKRLLEAMITQMDSALVHSRTTHQLAQRNRELEVIYRIDHIRDMENDFDSMLHQVLAELCKAVSGELGFIILYRENEEQQIEIKSLALEGSTISPEFYDAVRGFARECLATGHLLYTPLSPRP
jgi:GTP-sensing pleiotropic transcriptional regulator CodY